MSRNLDLLAVLIEDINSGIINSSEEMESIAIYKALSVEERRDFLMEIGELFKEHPNQYLTILSCLLDEYDGREVVEAIDRCLEECNMSFIDYMSFRLQYEATLFIFSVEYDRRKHWESKQRQFMREVDVIRGAFAEELKRIPYKSRNPQKIMLFINPMLTYRHGPTCRMINLYNILERLGYEVMIVAINTSAISVACAEQWKNARRYLSLYETTQSFCLRVGKEYFKGVNIEFTPENILDSARLLIDVVKEFNPVLGIEIGDDCSLVDLCRDLTDIVALPMTSLTPVNRSRIYLSGRESIVQSWQKELPSDKEILIIDYKDNLEEEYPEDEKYVLDRQGGFYGVIVGNRLDFEVNETVMEIIEQCLDRINELMIVIVGECNKLEQRIQQSQYKNRFICTGVVRNLEEVIGSCDIYINPPRVGGGISSRMAIKRGVPVITLPDCDVASNTGEEFCVSSLEEMVTKVEKYYTDQEYYNQQKQKIASKYQDKDSQQNLENVNSVLQQLFEKLNGT